MAKKLLLALLILCCFLLAFPALAQTAAGQAEEEKTFDLKHGEEQEEEDLYAPVEQDGPIYDPLIEERKLEGSITLGYMGLGSTLFEQSRIIYKYTDEFSYYGDVSITGESAFNPMLYLNYNLAPWLALEGNFGFSFSEYTAGIDNRLGLANSPDDDTVISDPALGEFDAENRSVLTVQSGVSAVFYPLDYGNFGRGRWHPFVLGGVSRLWMEMNSDYTDGFASDWAYNAGAGFRFVADDLISIRFQFTFSRFDVQFTPDEVCRSLDEGSRKIPIMEYVPGQGLVALDEFETQTVDAISWALGVTANF